MIDESAKRVAYLILGVDIRTLRVTVALASKFPIGADGHIRQFEIASASASSFTAACRALGDVVRESHGYYDWAAALLPERDRILLGLSGSDIGRMR